MKLYEINEAIARLMEQLTVDEETGELAEDTDSVLEQLHSLELDRRSVLEYLAKLVLNIRAEKAALKAEEQRLKSRRDVLDHKEDRIMRVLDRECAGERTSLGIATFGYRKTSHVEVSDTAKAIRWLKRHKYTDCFRVPEPEVAKIEVKKLINSGTKVPGCSLVEDYSCSLK